MIFRGYFLADFLRRQPLWGTGVRSLSKRGRTPRDLNLLRSTERRGENPEINKERFNLESPRLEDLKKLRKSLDKDSAAKEEEREEPLKPRRPADLL